MSHKQPDKSEQADQRNPWHSISSVDRLSDSDISDFEAHDGDGQRLSLLSAFSRPSSGHGEHYAPIASDKSVVSEIGVLSGQSLFPSSPNDRGDAPAPSDNNQGFDERDVSPLMQKGNRRSSSEERPNQSVHPARGLVAQNRNDLDRRSTSPRDWIPYTLRRPFLISLASTCLVLCIVLAVLTWYSATHHGLGYDDGSVAQFFGWRYTPTLIAVLFTQAVVMTAEDIKRTEPFARLSQSEPPIAKHTLFYIPKVWWKNVFPRRNGVAPRTWILALSSLATALSLLVISSFSSSVLIARDVLNSSPVHMQRYIPAPNGTMALAPTRDTYFRTVNAHLYNVSTSTWVSDSHVIIPIAPMPQDLETVRTDPSVWEAETTIFQLENECMPMNLVAQTQFVTNFTSTGNQRTCARNNTCHILSKGLELRSNDGCTVQVHMQHEENPIAMFGGIYWTNMSSSYVSMQKLILEHGNKTLSDPAQESLRSRVFIYSLSDECFGRDLVLATPPWGEVSLATATPQWNWNNITVQAEVCTPKIYEASVSVRLQISGNVSQASFDAFGFTKWRRPTAETRFDLGRLDDLTFGKAWYKYAIKPGAEVSSAKMYGFEGVGTFLAQSYDMDINAILGNTTLGAEASRFRSRFFGELVLSSILQKDAPALETIAGDRVQEDRRILVVTEAVITLLVSLLLVLLCLLFLYRQTVLSRRPLHLSVDPATIGGTALLLDLDSGLAKDLRNMSRENNAGAAAFMETRVYSLQGSGVTEVTHANSSGEVKSRYNIRSMTNLWKKKIALDPTQRRDWRPSMLKKRWLATFLIFLVALIVSLLVLRRYARGEKLNRTAFTYQFDLGIFNTSLSPHSIIVTLVAVTISLFWDSIDKPLRRLQPYLAMTREPSHVSQGASLSYQTSYWLWAAAKAARRKHWVLSLVTFGTTLTQILVVSMAAIFEQHTVVQNDLTGPLGVYMRRPEVRETPFEYSLGLPWRPFYLTENVVGVTQADWLSTALDEVVLGSPPPAWTKDEWVFPPVKFHSNNGSVSGVPYFGLDVLAPSANITFGTPAFRGRLECSNVQRPGSNWLERAQDVFPNQTRDQITGYVLPKVLFDGGPYNTSAFSAPRTMACCTNGTSPNDTSVIAYWSSSSPLIDVRPPGDFDKNVFTEPNTWTNNFTIKWIVGHTSATAIEGNQFNGSFYRDYSPAPGSEVDDALLYFASPPQISAIHCMPVVEQANASITVARYTGQVLDVNIFEQPKPASAVWAHPWDVVYDNPQPNTTLTTTWDGVETTEVRPSNSCTVSVSPGTLFLTQLLAAPHMIHPRSGSLLVNNLVLEDVSTERFSIRDQNRGLNMDFMSRSNFFLAGDDAASLLDPSTLIDHSQHTFQTFFKHFAARGSRDGESIFWDDGYDGGEDIGGAVVQRMQVLSMNETATWLSVAIILLLIAILLVVVVALQVAYPVSCMQHPVDCLADTLMMIAGSDEFVSLAKEGGLERSRAQTRLGWFRDVRGVNRWGVEVVDSGKH